MRRGGGADRPHQCSPSDNGADRQLSASGEGRAWNCADASLSPAELAQAAPALAAWAIVQLGMLLTASQSQGTLSVVIN